MGELRFVRRVQLLEVYRGHIVCWFWGKMLDGQGMVLIYRVAVAVIFQCIGSLAHLAEQRNSRLSRNGGGLSDMAGGHGEVG